MAGKGGGAWKVAYADFVTAMMAFFMVMWLVAQSKPMKEAIASYFNDPSGKNPREGNGKSNGMLNKDTPPPPAPRGPLKGTGHRQAVAKSINDEGTGRGTARQVVAMNLRSNNDLVVEAIVAFDEGSADLDVRARQSLDKLAEDLIGKWSKIEIRGHTSARPLPSGCKFHDDWQLSFARSNTVMKYLTDKGLESKRFRLSESGANEPASQGQNYGLAAPDGRVEVFVLGEIVGSARPIGKGKEKVAPADNSSVNVRESPVSGEAASN
jgi:chemotaxis protein MotB